MLDLKRGNEKKMKFAIDSIDQSCLKKQCTKTQANDEVFTVQYT